MDAAENLAQKYSSGKYGRFMNVTSERLDHVSIAMAATVGVVAGLIASLMMDRFQAGIAAFVPPAGDAESANDKAANRLSKSVTGHALDPHEKSREGQIVHYAFGAGLGALYGVAAEHWQGVTLGHGSAFSFSVAVLFDETAVPALGLGDPPWETSSGTHVYSFASHFVYGVILETARLLFRNALRPEGVDRSWRSGVYRNQIG